MGCDDGLSLDELISKAIAAQLLAQIDDKTTLDSLLNKDAAGNTLNKDSSTLDEILASIEEPCETAASPIFTKEQLEDLACLLDESATLPNQPSTLSLDVGDVDPLDEECDEKLHEINEILKIELKEYNDLNILLGRLEEYKDNYRVFTEYFSERAKESARLLNKFQPVLEEIRRLEEDILRLKAEIDTYEDAISALYDDQNYSLNEAEQALKDAYVAEIEVLEGDIKVDEDEIKVNEDLRDTYTSQEAIIKDAGISSVLSGDTTAATATVGHNSTFIYELNAAINASDYSGLKNSIDDYSSTIKVKRVTVGGVKTIIQNPIISFELKFIGLNHMRIEEDRYNEETGERNTAFINFPIKSNNRLHNNSFFDENQGGVKVSNASVSPEPTGALYTKYYDKFKDPMRLMFTPGEKGLTSSVTAIDPNLIGTGFEKKKEGSTEYYVKNFTKMQNFYENFEGEFAIKKQQIRKADVEPLFSVTANNMKKLARLDIRLLLALGRINLDIIDESSDLRIILKKIEEDQIAFLRRAADLDKELPRIKARMKELKPTPENMKKKLLELSPRCFEDKSQDEPASELKKIADEKEGDDPFGIKTLGGVDPTVPSANDMIYWKQFAKVLNMVNLLPLPKDPSTLRYWPVGFIIPTPLTIIKIPLPIIWIPIVTIPTAAGIIVVFITINGIFISPIVFLSSSSGIKQHKLTIRGASKQFGYDSNREWVKPTINFPLGVLAAKDAASKIGSAALGHLSPDEKKEYGIKYKVIKDRLNNATGDSKKELKKKLKDLEDSVSNKSDMEKLKDNVDKKENVFDAIDDAKKSLDDRLDDLGTPEFENSAQIQKDIQENIDSINKSIEETYNDPNLGYKEKQKELKRLRKKLKKEDVSISQKKNAIKKDILKYFDKIELPTLTIPKDKTKIDPKENSSVSFKGSMDTSLSDFKYKTVSSNNVNIRKLAMKNLSGLGDSIDFSDIGINENGKINVKDNVELIKKKMLEMNQKTFDKIKGIDDPDLNLSDLEQQQEVLKKDIESEINPKKKKKLKLRLKKTDEEVSSINENKITKEDNAVDSSKLSKASKFKVDFNPFKSLSEMQPVKVDLNNVPKATTAPIDAGKLAMDTYIKRLTPETISSLFGGREEISPKTISDAYLNTTMSKIPPDINMPTSLNLETVSSSFMGVLSSLNLPMQKIDEIAAFSLTKPLVLNLNILKGPMKALLSSSINGEFTACLPTNIEDNFKNLNADDLKETLQKFISDKIDSFSKVLEPVYKLISFLKSADGVCLTLPEKIAMNSAPFGTIIKARFIAETMIKINSPKSSNFSLNDLSAMKKAFDSIESILNPIFNVPMSFIIPAAAAMVQQQESMRLLHPVLNADDLPPWERLSEKNFLFILFLDEFITEAAEKIGFYRRFI